MTTIRLDGLEGSNPGAFLAALGVLEVLTEAGLPARLRWVEHAGWRPEVAGVQTFDQLVDAVVADLGSARDEALLAFTYPRESDKRGIEDIADLKAPPDWLRSRLVEPLARAASAEARSAVDLCAALVAEGGVDNNGQTKPSAFHFTAGQQKFLQMVGELRRSTTREHVVEGLLGPWVNPAPLPALGWDVGNSRDYALRATDPSSDKKMSQPAVEWLGFRGLRLLPCFVVRQQTRTTGVSGSWKRGRFTWPLWSTWLSMDTARTACGLPLQELDAATRRAWGLVDVLSSAIHRSDQGGYGSMGPPEVLP